MFFFSNFSFFLFFFFLITFQNLILFFQKLLFFQNFLFFLILFLFKIFFLFFSKSIEVQRGPNCGENFEKKKEKFYQKKLNKISFCQLCSTYLQIFFVLFVIFYLIKKTFKNFLNNREAHFWLADMILRFSKKKSSKKIGNFLKLQNVYYIFCTGYKYFHPTIYTPKKKI